MKKNAPAQAGLLSTVAHFVRNEDGAATVWNLIWMLGFGAMAGLAVDSTNARRVETIMASTADVAVLAGVLELKAPNYNLPYVHGSYDLTVKKAATDFALKNMSPVVHGDYMDNSDIYVGHWDYDNRTFEWGGTPINAVRAFVGRNTEKDNGVGTSFLRLIGFNQWDINTVATAAMKITKCYDNGVIAAGTLKINSNATIYSGCLHGEAGVQIQNNNIWYPGTGVSAGEESPISVGGNQFTPSMGPAEVNQMHRHLLPSDLAYDVEGFARGILDLKNNFTSTYNPEYQYLRVAEMQNPAQPVIAITNFELGSTVPPASEASLDDGVEVASLGAGASIAAMTGASLIPNPSLFRLGDMVGDFVTNVTTSANLTEYRTYYAPCLDGTTLKMTGTIRNIVLVSECKIKVTTNSRLENVVLVSLGDPAVGDSIKSDQGVRYGAADGCAPGGGVRVHSLGDFNSASGTQWRGAQLYIGGDFDLAGQTAGSRGISAHVAGDVHIAAQAEIAALQETVTVYDEIDDGGACAGEVDFEWITDDYFWVLVE